MSAKPQFDDTALRGILGGRPPARFDREGRIRLIGEAALALRDGRLPGREAALFVGGALLGWLQNGGGLERDYLQVVKPKSHFTPAYLWQQINAHPDEGQDTGAGVTLPEPSRTKDAKS